MSEQTAPAQRLRDAARGMRETFRPQGEARFCACEESDNWFDRSICPEPCGSMHNVCTECGLIQGYCPVAVEDRANSDRLSRSWLAVAEWLDDTASDTYLGSIAQARALAVADAFLGVEHE